MSYQKSSKEQRRGADYVMISTMSRAVTSTVTLPDTLPCVLKGKFYEVEAGNKLLQQL
jgi:hypothetical protein